MLIANNIARARITLSGLAAVFVFATIATAQSQESKSAQQSGDPSDCAQESPSQEAILFPVEMGIFKVKVNGMDGQPIARAEVEVSGVRCAEEPGSWIAWPAKNAGANNVFLTDENGRAEFKYPKLLGVPPNYQTTTTLTFRIRHPDFVAQRMEAAATAGELEIKMKSGCKIEFTAVDRQGLSVNEFGVFLADNDYSTRWLLENGVLHSSAVPDGARQTMLVATRKDGPTLFSGVLPARYVTDQPFTIRNVILTPGLCVQGKVADDVPRPIQSGIVVSWSQPKPNEDDLKKREAIGWQDSTSIAADGTFRFDSLPRTGTLQLIAICRGWVVVDQPRKGNEGRNFFKSGVLLDLNSLNVQNNLLADVELPMEAAGVVEVTVSMPDGSPLAGASVSTWPNQMLEHAGSQLLGDGFQTLHVIKAQLDPKYSLPKFWQRTPESRYIQKTDARGAATLYDIPLERDLTLHVEHDDFQAVDNDNQPKRMLSFRLSSTEPKKLEIIVEAIP